MQNALSLSFALALKFQTSSPFFNHFQRSSVISCSISRVYSYAYQAGGENKLAPSFLDGKWSHHFSLIIPSSSLTLVSPIGIPIKCIPCLVFDCYLYTLCLWFFSSIRPVASQGRVLFSYCDLSCEYGAWACHLLSISPTVHTEELTSHLSSQRFLYYHHSHNSQVNSHGTSKALALTGTSPQSNTNDSLINYNATECPELLASHF